MKKSAKKTTKKSLKKISRTKKIKKNIDQVLSQVSPKLKAQVLQLKNLVDQQKTHLQGLSALGLKILENAEKVRKEISQSRVVKKTVQSTKKRYKKT
ncbi:MAG: hypothetical protein BroJett040_16040 [Oligoflexia bacterium]|nr:MAG: hypothetical protein BroJett040_16040 [Oligoflexia bacterium]